MNGIYGMPNSYASSSFSGGFSGVSRSGDAYRSPYSAEPAIPPDESQDVGKQLSGKVAGFGPEKKAFDDVKIAGLKKEKSPLEEIQDKADGCDTCKSRKYQDGSNDGGVSYKTPTKIGPNEAAAAVASHENQHVVREQAKAERENREIVSQSVSYKTAVCPECQRSYVSGGLTRTVSRGKRENPAADMAARAIGIGNRLNAFA